MTLRPARRLRAATAGSGCGAATAGVCPCSDEVIACDGDGAPYGALASAAGAAAGTGALATCPGPQPGSLRMEGGGEGRATTITIQATGPETSVIDGEHDFGAMERNDATLFVGDLSVRRGVGLPRPARVGELAALDVRRGDRRAACECHPRARRRRREPGRRWRSG